MKKLILLASIFCITACVNWQQPREANESQELTEIEEAETASGVTDEEVPADPDLSNRFEGVYECSRTGDIYIFEADNTGRMIASGFGTPATFEWTRKGANVTLVYTGESEAYGSQKLQYDEKEHYILEESISFGTLVFRKK